MSLLIPDRLRSFYPHTFLDLLVHLEVAAVQLPAHHLLPPMLSLLPLHSCSPDRLLSEQSFFCFLHPAVPVRPPDYQTPVLQSPMPVLLHRLLSARILPDSPALSPHFLLPLHPCSPDRHLPASAHHFEQLLHHIFSGLWNAPFRHLFFSLAHL